MPCWHRKCQSFQFQSCHIKKKNKHFFWGNSSPCYATHLCQPILNQSPKGKPLNFTSLGLRLSSHTSLFWTLLEQSTPRICAHPSWTYLPKIHHKTSDPKIFISHICFELCRNSSPCYTTHVSQPILNQRPKTHYKLQIRKFSSHTSLFWTLPEQITPRICANPSWTYLPKLHHKTSDPRIFISHICFELCRNSSPCYTTHTHVSQLILNQRPKTHYKLQIRKFSSHTSLFWTLPEQITPRMCANPSWTYLPQIHHKTSNLKIFISHICFELCRNSSPCYTTHVSQPILYQCPKIHHKRLMTQFCKPIPIQPPKIHLSKFQRSPYRRQKCRALQEDTVEWKPVCDLQAKNGSQ